MRLTLGRQMGLSFGVILVLTLCDSTVSYVKSSNVQRSQDTTFEVRYPTLEAARRLQRDLNQTQSTGRDSVIAGSNPQRRDAAKLEFDAAWDEIEKDMSDLDNLAPKWSQAANRERLAEIKAQLPLLHEAQRSAIDEAAGERDAVIRAGNVFADQTTPINENVKKILDMMAASFVALLDKNREELHAENRSQNLTLAVATSMALAIGLFLAAYLSRRISSATQAVLARAEAIAAGDLTGDELRVQNQDELGDLTSAINKMRVHLRRMILAITENAQHVASASEELNASSRQIFANSEETSAQAGIVSEAVRQVNQNLHGVSTGAEEMTSTIQSVATNAHEAATVAGQAVQTAQAANTTVGKLGDSSAEIGEVIKVITAIAQQTKLLALNATIEAARAGEAGKGFAVVANEVKELAGQTAKATGDISQKIVAIQTDTNGAVEAIRTISAVINQINDISGTIATAVEEQSATTNEMTRNIADAAKGSGEITKNIARVADAASGTTNSARESQKAVSELAEMAEQLRGLVSQFNIDNGQANASTTMPRARAARAGN